VKLLLKIKTPKTTTNQITVRRIGVFYES